MTPPMMMSMHASICSIECVEMWAVPMFLKRSVPAADQPLVPSEYGTEQVEIMEGGAA